MSAPVTATSPRVDEPQEADFDAFGGQLVPIAASQPQQLQPSGDIDMSQHKTTLDELLEALDGIAKQGREAMKRGGEGAPMVSNPALAMEAILRILGSAGMSFLAHADPEKSLVVDKPSIDKETGAERSVKGMKYATFHPRSSTFIHFAGQQLGTTRVKFMSPPSQVKFAFMGPDGNFERMEAGDEHAPKTIDDLSYTISISEAPLPGMTTPVNPYTAAFFDGLRLIQRYCAYTRMMQGGYDHVLGPAQLDPRKKPEDVQPALALVLSKFKKLIDVDSKGVRFLSLKHPHSVPVKKTKDGKLDERDANYKPPKTPKCVAEDLWNRPVRGTNDQRRRMVRVPIWCAKPPVIDVTHQITDGSKKRTAEDAELGESEQTEKKTKGDDDEPAAEADKKKKRTTEGAELNKSEQAEQKNKSDGEAEAPKGELGGRLGFPFYPKPDAAIGYGDVVCVAGGLDFIEWHSGQGASMMPRRLEGVVLVGQRGRYDWSDATPVDILKAFPTAVPYVANNNQETDPDFSAYNLQDDYCC